MAFAPCRKRAATPTMRVNRLKYITLVGGAGAHKPVMGIGQCPPRSAWDEVSSGCIVYLNLLFDVPYAVLNSKIGRARRLSRIAIPTPT